MLTTLEYLEIKEAFLKELNNLNISEDRRQVIMEAIEMIDMNIRMINVA